MTSKSEKSYIQSSLLSDPPLRADGRGLLDYRSILVETGIVAQANGSARVNVGGTEIVAACKLEVEDVESIDGIDGGRLFCAVSWSVYFMDPNISVRLLRRRIVPYPHMHTSHPLP
jgi:exosome complex component RRP42